MSDVGNWVGELTTTIGAGDITLGGQIDGFTTFSSIASSDVWYAIIDGDNREAGQGTISGNTLTRTTVHSTLVAGVYDGNSPSPIDLSGGANVFSTFNRTMFDLLNDGLTKLDGIESGSTADQTDVEIKTAYEANADTNEFSDAEQSKLSGIETSATADQTGAEIKTAYEAEANAFTDAKDTKLTGIETAATADQTGAEIKTAYEAEADTNAFTDADKTTVATIVPPLVVNFEPNGWSILYDFGAGGFFVDQWSQAVVNPAASVTVTLDVAYLATDDFSISLSPDDSSPPTTLNYARVSGVQFTIINANPGGGPVLVSWRTMGKV